MSTIKAEELEQLNERNKTLMAQVTRIVTNAHENNAVISRFQDYEAKVLAADNISDLMEVLVFSSLEHFDLNDCRLIWFDQPRILEPILKDITRNHFGDKLVFKSMSVAMNTLFSESRLPQLKALNSAENDFWFKDAPEKVMSSAFIPLINKADLVGCLIFGSNKEDRFVEGKAVDFMDHMGMIVATCLQNMAGQEQIRLLSLLDNLTQVKNRRSFDQDILIEVARAERNRQPLSCLFIDADYFKNVNDTYGHQAGDETLRCMAKWAESQLRETDHIARYGGEEFAVLLPDCDKDLALDIANRIRKFVEKKDVIFDDTLINITLSIGASTYDSFHNHNASKEETAKQLVAQADSGVYDAKEGGRNRVCFKKF